VSERDMEEMASLSHEGRRRGRRAAAGERQAATAVPQLRARSVAPSVLLSSGTHASAPAGRPPRLPAHRGFNISAAAKVFDRMLAREGRVVTSPW
jgi:hypothetical protein